MKRAVLDLSWQSFRDLQAFRTGQPLQISRVFRVAGEEEDLVFFREGSDGLDGGGAAGVVHVGELVVEEVSIFKRDPIALESLAKTR